METQTTEAEQNIEIAKENHIEAINNAIDAIINLEDFGPLSNALSMALSKLNSMRHYAESEIESGSRVWDSFNKKQRTVQLVGAVNLFFTDGESVGTKYCFPISY